MPYACSASVANVCNEFYIGHMDKNTVDIVTLYLSHLFQYLFKKYIKLEFCITSHYIQYVANGQEKKLPVFYVFNILYCNVLCSGDRCESRTAVGYCFARTANSI